MNDSSIQLIEACEEANKIPTSKKIYVTPSSDTDKTKWMKMAYRECLKNHAAALGSHSVDGCGEYMPSSSDNALLCMACGCHRNFHRKVVDVGGVTSHRFPSAAECSHYMYNNTKSISKNKTLEGTQGDEGGLRARCRPHTMTRSLSEGHVTAPSVIDGGQITEEGVIMNNSKKRYRTKFTNEQKEKMFGFAEKAGWKMQKKDEGLVQQFCQEVGIKRRVLKVWMHNNKHLFVQKTTHNSTTINDDNDASE